MVQRLSAGLAQQIVISEPLLDNTGQVNRQTLKILFDRLMTLNPSVELSSDLAGWATARGCCALGAPQTSACKYRAAAKFLAGSAWPVYGDDPRSTDKQKVFSVAPIHLNGELRGYLYIILQGEELNALADTLWQKSALECATVVTATGGRVWSVGRDVGLVLGNAPSKTIDGECQQD